MPTGPIVPDTSAWIEFLRGTGSAVSIRVRELQRDDADLVVPGPVLLEVLAGTRTEHERVRTRDFLARYRYAALEEPTDFVDAARVFRACRDAGRTIRGHADCLIAVVAMRLDAAVLHNEADFDAIAEVAPLRIA